jgi:surface polysaccharide O-acyltransferase-like enzyme
MADRDLRLDRLRLLAAIAVVWLHAASLVVSRRPDALSAAWWTANMADAFSRWSVPVFVMLSGATGLPSAGVADPLDYYRRRAERVLLPLLAWTAIYLGFRVLTEPAFTSARALESIRLGSPYYHLWYLYMLVGLTLVMPFLGVFTRALDPRRLLVLTLICFAIAAPEIAFRPARATFLPMFLPFMGYALAGHLLMRGSVPVASGTLLRLAVLGGYLTAILTGLLLPAIGPKALQVGYHYLNPIVVMTALALFAAFRDPAIRAGVPDRVVRWSAPLTFGVFLMHPLWLWAIDRGLGPVWKVQPWWGIPVVTALTLGASLATTSVVTRLPLLRRIV